MTRLDLIEEFENKTEQSATWSNGGMGGYTEEYTKWLEQRLVKNLAIPVVSQQRELLSFFAKNWNENQTTAETTINRDDIKNCIEKYNCG